MVAPIRFAPLIFLQILCQRILKNHLVIPIPGLVRPVPPANIPRTNTQTYLVAVPAPLKLVVVKRFLPAHREAEVCAVYWQKTVISNISLLPVFENNLDRVEVQNERWSHVHSNNYTQQSTYQNFIQLKNRIDIWPHVLVDRLRVAPPQRSWQRFIVWWVSLHKCKRPQIVKELGSGGGNCGRPSTAMPQLRPLPIHRKIHENASLQVSQEQLPKPSGLPTHHALSDEICVIDGHLFCGCKYKSR